MRPSALQSGMQAAPGASHHEGRKDQEPGFCGLDHFTCCLAVFDTRQGQREGQEDDKVLAFFPTATVPPTTRTMIVGLAQALYGFASTFSQGEASQQGPWVVMEAQNNTWMLHECEPNIWVLVVVSKAWIGSSLTHVALRAHLSNLHAMATLLHGPIQHTLDQVDAGTVRRQLQPLLEEAGRLLLAQGPRLRLASAPAPLTREASALANPLGLHTGVPLLVTPETPFLGAQCLAGRLLNLHPTPGPSSSSPPHADSNTLDPDTDTLNQQQQQQQPVLGVHVAWHGMPVWSTLGDERDVLALHGLIQRALLPAAGIGRKKTNTIKAALAAAAAASSTYMRRDTTATAAGDANPTSPPTPAASSSSAAAPFPNPDLTAYDTLLSPAQWSVVPPVSSPPAPSAGQPAPSPFQSAGPSGGVPPAAASASPFRPLPQQQQQLPATASSGGSNTAGTAAAAGATPGGLRASAQSLAGKLPGQNSGLAPGQAAGASATGPGSSQPLTGWLFPAAQPASGSGDQASLAMPAAEQPDGTGPGGAAGAAAARVWLHGEGQFVGLLPFYHGALMVVLLLGPGVAATPQLMEQAQEVLLHLAPSLSSQLQGSLPTSSNLWHQKGYRYCHEDDAAQCTRSTPIKKVTTLSENALRLAARTRNKLDHWVEAGACAGVANDNTDQPAPADSASEQPPPLSSQAGTSTDTSGGSGPTGGMQQEGDSPAAASTTTNGLPAQADEPMGNGGVSADQQDGTNGGPGMQRSGLGAEDGIHGAPGLQRSGLGAEGDYEVVTRTATDTWVVVRRADSRRMLVAVDQVPVPSLLGVTAHVNKLCDRLYPGYFTGHV